MGRVIMTSQPIVVIDDDRSWVEATGDLLREEGYEVQTALDGEHALALLDNTRPCVVIMDMHMPRLSGLDVLRELRQQRSDLPIIMVSADDQSSVMAEAMNQGASLFLRKPVASGLILRAVRRFLQPPDGGGFPDSLQAH
jgi:DNA-binding response OmpR family regulator